MDRRLTDGRRVARIGARSTRDRELEASVESVPGRCRGGTRARGWIGTDDGETLERVFFEVERGGGDDEGEAYAWTVETYRRAQDEYRRRSGKTDGASVAVCEELGQCMEFCALCGGVARSGVVGTFPQSARATARGACQLLDVMRGSSGIPNGYLSDWRPSARTRIGGGGGEDFRQCACRREG